MKNLVFLLLFSVAASANATIIDFDSVGTSWVNIDQHVEGDFNLEKTNHGFASVPANYIVSYWLSNNTGTVITWSNSSGSAGSFSGFTLTNNQGDLFDLNAFDVGNAYLSGNSPITSILMTGTFGAGGTINQTFSGDFTGWQTLGLAAAWSGLESVVFRANGQNNRAMWDNIVVNNSLSPVPVPAAIWLFASALVGLIGFGKHRKAASPSVG